MGQDQPTEPWTNTATMTHCDWVLGKKRTLRGLGGADAQSDRHTGQEMDGDQRS